MGDAPKSILRCVAVMAAVAFIGFFVWIIIIADSGEGVPWWSFIHQIPFGDKVGHLGLASSLSLLCNLAFTRWKPARKRFITVTTWVLLVLLSMEELSQGFIPHRHLDFLDWLADVTGLAVGQMIAMRIGLQFISKLSTQGTSQALTSSLKPP